MDPAKLKVTELRGELSKRGLDTKGNKAVLVERLRNALENETDDPGDDTAEIENEDVLSREKSPEPPKQVSPAKTPGRSSRSQASPKATPTRAGSKMATSPGNQKTPTTPSKSPINQRETSPLVGEKTTVQPDEKADEEKPTVTPPQPTADDEEKSAVIATPQTATVDDKSSEPQTSESAAPQVAQEAPELPAPIEQESQQQQTNEPEQKTESIAPEVVEEPPVIETTTTVEEPKETEEMMEDKIDEEQPEEEGDDLIDEDKLLADDEEPENENESEIEKVEINETTEENKDEEYPDKIDENNDEEEKTDVDSEKNSSNDTTETEESKDDKMPMELESKIDNNENCKVENEHDVNEDTEMKDDVVKDDKEEKDTKDNERKDRKDRKRKRSSSSQDERQKTPQPATRPDDEPEIDYSRVLLSWYDSDLNLVIDKTKFLSATPMHNDGFGYVWAGARASHGFKSGKIYYEVKITHECNVTLQDEQDPHVLRAGWSVSNTSMQLGEEKLSYGYGGTGKTSTNLQFNDYGPKFGLNDILTCLIDFTDDEKVSISYKLNGKDLGEAFSILKTELDGKSLFPHILTKNCGFVCNFGDEEAWTEEIPDGFIPVSNIDINERTLGPKRPDKREDCEVLMMIGLPGAGKTTWAYKHAQDNPDKMYNILGTNMLIDKMKVSGLPRKKAYNVRWEILYPQCERCLITLLEVATLRRRNYILDQTNVYPSAQRRKMRHFNGFQRKAVLIVPTDEELKSRIAKREAVEGKDIPEDGVLKMKANFEAPTVGESFDSIDWVELPEDEGKKLIAKYNKEGKDAGYGQQQSNKRPRFEKSNDSHRDNRDVRSSRDSRDSRDHRDRRNAYSDRNRSSTWRGGNQMSSSGGGGGYRDRVPPRGNNMRHGSSSSGYGSSSGGWRGRGGQSNLPYRGNDRRGPSSDRRSSTSDRRVSSNRQGGWGPMNSNYHNSSSSNWAGSHGGSGGGGWSGPSSQGQWSQSSAWANSSGGGGGQGSWGGNWKGYGSNSQSSYGASSYGNGGGGGGWGTWNSQQQQQQQQYYSQYWGQQSQGQTGAISGQTSSSGASTTAASSSSTGSTYNNYPQSWGNYSGSYSYSTDSSNPSSQK